MGREREKGRKWKRESGRERYKCIDREKGRCKT